MADEKHDVIKEIAKDVYADLGHPVAAPTGELAGLLPRAIKAALAPVEKWVLQKEYNVAETKALLEEKLKKVSPERIEPPEAHIAVPAMQYISYCMDNDELRDLYANLLASSMVRETRQSVHPGFVDIIRQMTPDEARVMRYFHTHELVPILTVSYEMKQGGYIRIVSDFSDIGSREKGGCEFPLEIKLYFDNLIRLGLLEKSMASCLTDDSVYERLKERLYALSQISDEKAREAPYVGMYFEKGYIRTSEYGKKFCQTCVSPAEWK